ncbi:MAG TPA: FtsX-like permease family protein [Steroidobacteraceae bacterium]|nr:FtsX-like permease family protein [Steroidobacteraceae bacterium]
MNLLFKIVRRNILRNRRRSIMTGSAVAAGSLALLLFGGFTRYIFAGLETGNVQRNGHLTVFHSGYFLFGEGNPAAYGIPDYRGIMRLIREDPVLSPMINVLTPTQSVLGIAGNFSGTVDASKTFLGEGVVPSDRNRMLAWDPYHTRDVSVPDGRMADSEQNVGLLGFGMARVLGLCGPLRLQDCPSAPDTPVARDDLTAAVNTEVLDLANRDTADHMGAMPGRPQIQLLAATADGAPNVVSLTVAGVERQGVRELDDNYVIMDLPLAQQLVYGRGDHKVTGIVLQLRRTSDMPAARARLATLIEQHRLPLEIRDFAELNPFYGQVVRLFSGIFLFIALVMGMIVLFAVVNTMTMNVMERTNEIGTTRALGVRRRGIRQQFLMEGMLIGAIGAVIGSILAIALSLAVNHAGLTWVPPGNANPIPLRVDVLGEPGLIIGAWVGLVLVATLAALLPANRAARLSVVDALRHV